MSASRLQSVVNNSKNAIKWGLAAVATSGVMQSGYGVYQCLFGQEMFTDLFGKYGSYIMSRVCTEMIPKEVFNEWVKSAPYVFLAGVVAYEAWEFSNKKWRDSGDQHFVTQQFSNLFKRFRAPTPEAIEHKWSVANNNK